MAADAAPAYDPVPQLARELSLAERSVAAVVRLLAEGATVPFIARYRKELTGGLDEVQIRAIEERRAYVLELEDRRRTILRGLEEAGKLTPELRGQILACTTKAALEDLYLPHKPKRRTRAIIARERGLAPLAERILAQPESGDPVVEAAAYLRKDPELPDLDVPDAAAALAGARDIIAELAAERPELRAYVRELFQRDGVVRSQVAADKVGVSSKFELYNDFEEKLATIPSHRYLAVRRGEQDGFLRVRLLIDVEAALPALERGFGLRPASPFAELLRAALKDSFSRLLAPSIETEVRIDLKMRADREAVEVFAQNLRTLLLAAPLGGQPVVALDPGHRTGCKLTAIDATGKVVDTATIYPGQGKQADQRARQDLAGFLARHAPRAIAIGNGTGGREAESFVREVLAEAGISDLIVVVVSEAGASVYSASEIAREELPGLDVSLRGAASIGRRLQDPLAELVKIDPKAIGVGQYQHDVFQPLLARKLEQVVESCVNHVGVDLNTASAPLLARVSGVGPSLARSIVRHRDERGAFRRRRQLMEVAGLGPRTYELCAGFMRIIGGEDPLDASAVHPERYELVARIAADLGVSIAELLGDGARAAKIPIERYVGEGVGEPTLRDIIAELQRPGRDPRAGFDPPKFRADVTTIADLKEGMVLEGVVTNVTAFGAFVDLGVHQDGLVHISQLADRFVKDPHEVVKAGDRLKVRVVSVDLERKRIALSARRDEPAAAPGPRTTKEVSPRAQAQTGRTPQRSAPSGPRAEDFRHNPFMKLRK
jgi:uncharacterized protein